MKIDGATYLAIEIERDKKIEEMEMEKGDPTPIPTKTGMKK